jgi:hypothetical protein
LFRLACLVSLWGSIALAQPTSLPSSMPASMPLDESYQSESLPFVWLQPPSTQPTKGPKTPLSIDGRKRPWTVAILPLPVYSSDLGVGGAIQTNVYDHRRGVKPYGTLYESLILYSSRGTQIYLGAIERPEIWGKYRLRVQAAYLKDPYQYFGLGNETVRDKQLEADGFYQSPLRLYGGTATLRRKLGSGFQLVGLLDSRRYFVDAPAGTLVRLENPSGIEGNRVNQAGIGIFRDTRNNEAHATSGSFYEFSLRVAPDLVNVHPFAGGSFIARHYFSPIPKLTLAGRLVLDVMLGDVPFTTQDKFGLDSVYSLGGGRSMRGFTEGRYIGKVKGLTNWEIRSLPITTTIRGYHFNAGGVLFADVGRVLADINTPFNGVGLHVGFGAGLRILYEKDFLVRFDVGHSNEDAVRFYLDVGHIF